MTDIVNDLRDTAFDKDNLPRMKSERACPVGLALKAADEIEKLREQLETAYMYGHDMAKAEYRHCVQEVEGENDRLLAENERLRQEIKQNEVDLEEYRLDVERMRGALKSIINVKPSYGSESYEMLEIATAALEVNQ